jgi:ABC-2 type transport system permease protein
LFAHIFIYRLKCLLRDRETIFWTALFPLILGTLFYMAFSNLNNNELFQPINIAVVNDSQYQMNESFKQALNKASAGEQRLFNATVTSKDQADKMLSDNLIDGYIVVEEPIKLVVAKSGINQNIIKSFIDNYMQTVSAVKSILAENPSAMPTLLQSIENRENFFNDVPISKAAPDNTLNYFYTLIAMACFYGGFIGMREVTDIQANISPVAARVNIAPVNKMKAFLYSSAASFLIHFFEMLILLAYLIFVLRIDFGNKTAYGLLATFIGSIAGLSFGAFISALVKKSEGVKVALLITVTMTCSFLSGMMYQNMKYIVARNAPVLSWLNPLNLLTDAFYSLYYYDTFARYVLNIAALSIFSIAFCSGTYIIIRRRKYASI